MKFLILDHCDRAVLSFEELTTVKRNLQTDGNVEVDYELIRETWHPVYRRHFLRKALRRCHDCRRGFFMYSKGIESDVSFRILTSYLTDSYIVFTLKMEMESVFTKLEKDFDL